ncbi:hypothetical protein DSO57_1018159 [Entomophthora muscae]|uniref:Uncharacterized protein n=1 Tax=Entomophthora muscae TaxID=34485 RepID=A0ACC2TG91_9FUNG|nr:hypothetical protein DSO57_1018159 [Entomophthora muscae]
MRIGKNTSVNVKAPAATEQTSAATDKTPATNVQTSTAIVVFGSRGQHPGGHGGKSLLRKV